MRVSLLDGGDVSLERVAEDGDATSCIVCEREFNGRHGLTISSGRNLNAYLCVGCAERLRDLLTDPPATDGGERSQGHAVTRRVAVTNTMPGVCAACTETASSGDVIALGTGPAEWDAYVHDSCLSALCDALEEAEGHLPDVLAEDV